MRRIPDQKRTLQCGKQLETLIEKELQNKIIDEVKESQIKWFNQIFAIPKRGNGKWRKITDCSELNDQLQEEHFKKEDIHVLRELMKQNDWMIKIDIESTYHHFPVNSNFRDFLEFKFKERSFIIVAMHFGIKHAPLVFQKIMMKVMQFFRETMQLRCIDYSDDLIFFNQDKELFNQQIPAIRRKLNSLGWIIAEEQSCLIPNQQVEFLRWGINSLEDRIQMTTE
ncbi:MAG: putative reverse transcriptase [Streblomastix strix]|uniref:Putative reverse transcriptase n=1 Tax=Streblomastix strix TaxID=222440 RepID=A0A5J4TVF9_9EUKA|nr:MAG: putative reverse transcriptase [Streblomastix strix]